MSREINLISHHTLTIYILFLICDHTLSAQKPGTGDATPQKSHCRVVQKGFLRYNVTFYSSVNNQDFILPVALQRKVKNFN